MILNCLYVTFLLKISHSGISESTAEIQIRKNESETNIHTYIYKTKV